MPRNVRRLSEEISCDVSARCKLEKKLVRTLAKNVKFSKRNPSVYCPKILELLTQLRKFRLQTGAYSNAEWKIERELTLCRSLIPFDKERYSSQLADALFFFARFHYKSGRYDVAAREINEAVDVYCNLVAREPSKHVKQIFFIIQGLIKIYGQTRQFHDAERLARELLARCDKLDPPTRAKYESEVRKLLQKTFEKEAQTTQIDSSPSQKQLEFKARGLKRQARAELRKGRVFAAEDCYKKAIATLRECLASSRSPSALTALVRILEALGRLRCDERLGKLDEAEQNLEEATNIWRELAENDVEKNVDAASSLATLAYLRERSRRWNVAESEYLESLAYARAARTRVSSKSATDKLETTTLFRLASVYARIGRKELAIARYKETLEKELQLFEDAPDAYRADVAITRFKLANLYKETLRWEDAKREYEEALTLYRRLNAEQPEKYNQALASTLNNLAALQNSRKRPAREKTTDARPNYEETLKILGDSEKQTSSKKKAAMATALHNSAGLRRRNGDFEGAENEYLRSLALRRELALENPIVYEDEVARTLNNLARLYCSRKDDSQIVAKAEPLLLEALATYRRRNASGGRSRRLEIARALYELGEFYRNAKEIPKADEKYGEAKLILRDALALDKSNADDLRLELSRVLRKIGETRQEVKRYGEALDAFKNALEQFDALQAPPSWKILSKRAETLEALAELYRLANLSEEELQARRDGAETYARLAQEEPEKKRGERASSFFKLAFALQRRGNFEESEKYYDQALELQRLLATDSNADSKVERRRAVANTLNNLSIVRRQTGRIKLAVDAAREALTTYRELERENPGKFKSSIAQALNNLSILLRAQRKFNDAEKAVLEALGIRRLELERNPNQQELRARVASLLFNLANIYRDERRQGDAKDVCAQATDIYRELAENTPEYQGAYAKAALLASQI